MSGWKGYILENYRLEFDRGSLVIDIGCGYGQQMDELKQQGCLTLGVDLDHSALLHCRNRGLDVTQARAEQIPLKDSSFDGIICKVVLPLTLEDQVLREVGRLLKPGAKCYLICHGAGYYLRYLLFPQSWKYRVYGLRSLVNTWLWALTGYRLPGFLGDTIYQSRRRLEKYYRENGLNLLKDTPSKYFLGFPVFIYQSLQKMSHDSINQFE